MEIFFVRALQLIMALSLLVLIHEFGHFLFARIFKVRVEKFYLFFDWKFSLFKWKPKNSDTEYGIGWVPLGGYCKIAGMIDESMDTEQMKQPAQEWEYRSKPAWQRLLIIVGGVMFNLILAILIYSMVLFTWGDYYIDMRTMDNGFEFNETAKNIGFKDGDKIIKFDGEEAHKLYLDKVRGADIFRSICDANEVIVQREGKDVAVAIPDTLGLLNMNDGGVFIGMRILPVVDSLVVGSIAHTAGLQAGDSILAIDGTAISSWSKIKSIAERIKSEKKESFTIKVMRDSVIELTAVTTPVKDDEPLQLGIFSKNNNYPLVHNEYGFFESFPAGVSFGMNVLRGYVSDFQYVFSAEGAQSVGMFASIGSLFPAEWNWHEFWLMTAFLSIILAFMNILPIPALDGGHGLFLIVEMITGKQPGDKFMERAQMVGMLIILGLFILAMYNDLMKFVF
ncbi:MAG: RIP metalloprotease RseP [Bacteroidaceae bacterium]|nr:RIP metalloprotease RseP [Bacteroidaceae bacterium]